MEQIRSRRICNPAIFFLSFLRRNQFHPLFNVSQAAQLVLLTYHGLLKPPPNFFPDAASGSGDGGKAGGLAFVASLLSLCFARDFVVVLSLPGGACKPQGAMGPKAAVFPLPYLCDWAVPASDSPLRCCVAEFGLGLSVTLYI